ncbi:hypothetical protein QBC47DRAFT_403543 [Echria macrotheca]|uniref:Amidoligase enzyme n=1 Tax=Echria macrotheca TaxID=438768 RepID=A0AAJ0B9H3_9PEZI|nr:hypothetical protein QBC47DRAFT_403543 [Echria macrotheca]
MQRDSELSEDDHAKNLAVAVELKFLLPLLFDGNSDPEEEDQRPPQRISARLRYEEDAYREQAYKAIESTIQQAGFSATTIQAILAENRMENQFWDSSWIVKKANSAEPGPDEKEISSNRYVWVSVEISSPKMPACDPNTYHNIKRVLNALNGKHRLRANYTCEVHIHLGRIDGQPFSLPTLKRLGSFLWAAEPILRSIRNPKSPNYTNIYTWGSELRTFSRLAQKISEATTQFDWQAAEDIKNAKIQEILGQVTPQDGQAMREIWQTETHQELGQLLSGPEKKYRRLGFNFSAFGLEDDRAQRSPRTIEFRIMEGTVQHDLILNWLSICTRIGKVALQSDSRFLSILSRLLRGLDSAGKNYEETPGCQGRMFRELMQDLGVPAAEFERLEMKVTSEHE